MIRKFNHGSSGKPDIVLMITFFVIIFLGILMLSSASSAVAFQKFGDTYYYVKHQLLVGLLPGLLFFWFLYTKPYVFWQKKAFAFLVASIALLVLVFIPGLGSTYGTAKSWINIFGFSIQPSEIVKLTFLMYLATWLSKRADKLHDDRYGFRPFSIIIGIIIVLMILQPDIGTMMVIVSMSLAVYFVAGAKWSQILTYFAIGATGLWFLIKTSPYRAARLTTFLHPELDPLGIGYHINQAFLAIGSGGILGRGFGLSRQKFQYLPEVAGDSIFAVIGEEMGFIATTLIVIGLIFFFYRGFKVAKDAPDLFSRLIVTGVMSWFAFQTVFNICAMVGLMPLTGVPLPFISYGGTSLMIGMGAMGLVLNISKFTKKE